MNDPKTGKTVLQPPVPAGRGRIGQRRSDKPKEFHLSALGAGSDYVAFIDHTGIASINVGFGGPNQGGVYHSTYDDMTWFKRFADPDFIYGKALSQVTATTLMRLADAPLLPFEFGSFSTTVKGYVNEIEKLANDNVNFHPILAELAKIDTDSEAYEKACTTPSRMASPSAFRR